VHLYQCTVYSAVPGPGSVFEPIKGPLENPALALVLNLGRIDM
jgi:hypothetical protein